MSSQNLFYMIVILLMILMFYIYKSNPPTLIVGVKNPKVPGYTFYQGQESRNNNIGNQASLVNNTSGLSGYCDSLPNCVGFNTDAWLKSSIRPQNEWQTWTTDPNKGLYIKDHDIPRGSNQEQFVPSTGRVGMPMVDPFNP